MKFHVGLVKILAAYATFPFVPVKGISTIKEIFEII